MYIEFKSRQNDTSSPHSCRTFISHYTTVGIILLYILSWLSQNVSSAPIYEIPFVPNDIMCTRNIFRIVLYRTIRTMSFRRWFNCNCNALFRRFVVHTLYTYNVHSYRDGSIVDFFLKMVPVIRAECVGHCAYSYNSELKFRWIRYAVQSSTPMQRIIFYY